MWNTPSGNSSFDGIFLVLQLLALVLSVAVLLLGRRMDALARPALVTAALLTVGAPIVWQVAFPPLSGIEGAGRLMLGVPSVLVNLAMIGIAAWRHARRA